MDLEIWLRDLEVRETLASSCGVSHGRISSKHWRKAREELSSSTSSCCPSLFWQLFLASGCHMKIQRTLSIGVCWRTKRSL